MRFDMESNPCFWSGASFPHFVLFSFAMLENGIQRIGYVHPAGLFISAAPAIDEVACFNTIFSISCPANRIIVFDSARYGRNDTAHATRCGVPFSRHCDIDVHFLMNRACAGRRKCTVMVNTALFGDPCGYEEFLRITYLCVSVSVVHNSCTAAVSSSTIYDHGFLSTPNYPEKYYMEADCRWHMAVQSRQTIRITIFDFELDIRRAGKCKDYLEVSTAKQTIFNDCGVLGKQTVDVESSSATVRFVTGQSSLTQRGFFLYFEASGPGCSFIPESRGVNVAYYIEDDVLWANASCENNGGSSGKDSAAFVLVKCVGTIWSGKIPRCIMPTVTELATQPVVTTVVKSTARLATGSSLSNPLGTLMSSTSLVGLTLAAMSAVLMLILLVMATMYCHVKCKRRISSRSRNEDKWRVFVNNLQENTTLKEDKVTLRLRQQCHLPINDRNLQCHLPINDRNLHRSSVLIRDRSGGVGPCFGSSADQRLPSGSTCSRRPNQIDLQIKCPECIQECIQMGGRHPQRLVPIPDGGKHNQGSGTSTEIDADVTQSTRQHRRKQTVTTARCTCYRTMTPTATLRASQRRLKPEYVKLSQSAPDLFTITQHSSQVEITVQDNFGNSNCICFLHDTVVPPPPDNDDWQPNIVQSPTSVATKLSSKDSGVFMNILNRNRIENVL